VALVGIKILKIFQQKSQNFCKIGIAGNIKGQKPINFLIRQKSFVREEILAPVDISLHINLDLGVC
jgi:hypothetical protein